MKPDEKKLLDLLSNNDVTFFIPPYQRNYEWESDQCSVFFDDVVKTATDNINGPHKEHFFGTVTYFQDRPIFGEPAKLVLIDGQQRITTTMLFLIAMRDTIEDDKVQDFINTRYLMNPNANADNTAYKIKLKQVETDWESYRKLILKEELTQTERASHVYGNYNYFKNRLLTYEGNSYDLLQYGLINLSIVALQLEPAQNSWENPQEIFESMNSLGKPLSLADLVRNYLLLGLSAAKQDQLYKKYWLFIEQTVPGKVSELIRDYMQAYSCHSQLKSTSSNAKQLYGTFKEIFRNENAEDLLAQMKDYSIYYSWIIRGESSGDERVDKVLADLRIANITTAYSFILTILYAWKKPRHFSDDDVFEMLDALRIYAIRRRVISITGAENKNLPLLSARLADLVSTTDKRKAMFDILSDSENALRLPNDIEMKQYMETMNFYNNRLAKYVLACVEEKLTKSRPDTNDPHLQIEHIMPQKLNEEWADMLGENAVDIHQQYINTIGNLTLIRHNQELGNKAFDYKKEIYDKHAGLQIAKTCITDVKKWNEKSIKKRADWLIEYILTDVFPIPDERRRINNFVAKNKGLSFLELQIIGETITFCNDKSITARVVNEKEVEFEGKKWRLSPLTREIQTRRGELNASGTYSGAAWWEYDGIRLIDII